MDEPERKHARFSPSQAERFFGCEGSANLLATVPVRPSSVYAVEGTKAHTVLEAGLTNRVRSAKVAHLSHSPLFCEELDNGSNQFYLSVQVALDYVYGILDAYPDAQMVVEARVDPPLPAAPGEAAGFCDIAISIPSQSLLYVIDYKHGAGVTKAAIGNKQAMQYGAGFLYEKDAKIDANLVDNVVLVIIQPRAFHEDGMTREYEVTPFELWEYLEELNDAVTACLQPDAPLTPGEEQCRFCDARTVCPAREEQALQVASSAFSQIGQVAAPQVPLPSTIDPQRLAIIRQHAPYLRKWLDDVDNHVEELVRAGHHVPGVKLVAAHAKRKYYGTDAEVAERLAAMIGDNTSLAAMAAYNKVMSDHPVLTKLFTQKLIPITTAEKLVSQAYRQRVGRAKKKNASHEAKLAFAYLTLKESSGALALADEDDKRPALNKAGQSFSNIVGVLPPPN